jgi:hypothetical protein
MEGKARRCQSGNALRKAREDKTGSLTAMNSSLWVDKKRRHVELLSPSFKKHSTFKGHVQ